MLTRQDWSVEQTAAWPKVVQSVWISHETIYQHSYVVKPSGGSLYRHPRCQKQWRKHCGAHDRRGVIPNRGSIDER